jgi:hypothetical protein
MVDFHLGLVVGEVSTNAIASSVIASNVIGPPTSGVRPCPRRSKR